MNVNKSETLWAIIACAGQSSRMGKTKALLKWQDRSFLGHISCAIVDSSLFKNTIAVTGHDHAHVSLEAQALGIESRYNDAYLTGMMSSLQAGIHALPTDVDYVLIALADQPQITSGFIQEFTGAFLQRADQFTLARIEVEGKPSPPCLIAKKYFAEILAQPQSDQGAQFLFKKYPDQVFTFQTESIYAQDIDTPEAYSELTDAY